MLTIALVVNDINERVLKNIDSVLNQKDKKFELIFINNANQTQELSKKIETLNETKIEKIKFYYFNKGLLNDEIIEVIKEQISGEFFYFINEEFFLYDNFVEEINKVINENKYDIIEVNLSKKNSLVNEKTYHDAFFSNKIFKTEFIKNNDINYNIFNFFPLINQKKWFTLNKKIIKFFHEQFYFQDLNYFLDSISSLILNDNNEEFTKNQDQYEALLLHGIFTIFLYNVSLDNISYEKKLSYLEEMKTWLEVNFPEWKKSSFFSDKNLSITPEIKKIIRKFRFTIKENAKLTQLLSKIY